MSRLLDKAFDASKKIIRSIFRGSPNLITSADLNRQVEAIKYQMDSLEERTGVLSDLTITHSLSAGRLSVTYSYSYLRFKGCDFFPPRGSLDINLTSNASVAYLCLVADTEVVTYEDDSTHEIAGAKFEDGTSMPAANQVRYKNEGIVLTHALSSLDNLVGVLVVFELSLTGNVIVKKNIIQDKGSLAMGDRKTISDFDPALIGRVGNGVSYDEAFSILANRFANLSPEWDYLTRIDVSAGSVEKDTEVAFRIQNGILYLNSPEQKIDIITTRVGSVIWELGRFPSNVKADIIAFLKRMNLATYNKFSKGYQGPPFIPYGEFGCFPIFSPYKKVNESVAQPMFGMAKVSLILEYAETDSGYELYDVRIGAYINGIMRVSSDTSEYTFSGPVVDWVTIGQELPQIFIPRFIGAVPLFGPI